MSDEDKRFVIPPHVFKLVITHITIDDGEITIGRNLSVDVTPETANVNSIRKQLDEKYGLIDSVLLNSQFEKIPHGQATSGELYWNWRTKYYVTSREEWSSINSDDKSHSGRSSIKYKRIKYPIGRGNQRATSAAIPYYPVTLPKPFRRAFTRLTITNGQLFTYKHIPIELTEYTAHVDTIKKIICSQTDLEVDDPVILDMRYQEVRDSPRTRGGLFWNTNMVFYFIQREDWEAYQKMRVTHNCNCPKGVPKRHSKSKTKISRSSSAFFYLYK